MRRNLGGEILLLLMTNSLKIMEVKFSLIDQGGEILLLLMTNSLKIMEDLKDECEWN